MNLLARIRASDAYKWYALGLLMLVGLFNYIDRIILSILQVPIKQEMRLTDAQLGALTGLAFSLVYTFMAMPIARFADRHSRKTVIVGALALWSSMTVGCSLAGDFATLLVLRMGVAIGEAGCVPASQAMLSDLFPRRQRATVLATFGLVFPLGTLIGFVSSGWLGTEFGWRTTFIVLGDLGLCLVPIAALTLFGPPRAAPTQPARSTPSIGLLTGLKTLYKLRALRHLLAGGALIAYPLTSVLYWNAPFYHRSFDMTLKTVSLYLALISGVGGAIGVYGAATLADRLARRDARWYMWLPGFGGVCAAPLLLVQYTTGNAAWSLSAGFGAVVCLNAFLAPQVAAAHLLVSPRMRAMASAAIVCSAGLIGTALGPFLTGVLSEWLASYGVGAASLSYSLAASGVPGVVGGILFLRGARFFPAELADY